ncbi:MAG: hypothetical protein LBJ69_02495 [Holosporales bacterium]|jgi:tetratricopeptide (TPR) repeat protein|nr:hypothetical protein [Holosporales bacterium]
MQMRLWKKFIALIAVLAVLFLMQMHAHDACNLEMEIRDRHLTVSMYFIAALFVSLLFLKALLRSLIALLISPFSRFSNGAHNKSVRQVVDLILASDNEFPHMFETAKIENRLSPIKTAIALRRNLYTDSIASNSGIPRIDIFIAKLKLRSLLSRNELKQAIEVAQLAVKKYPKLVSVIQDEVLEVAKLARQSGDLFSFEPRKFKYGLSRKFISEYLSTIGLLDFESEQNVQKKIKIVERILDDDPGNTSALIALLDTLRTTDLVKYSDKKVIQIIGRSLSLNPNRILADYLLRLNRPDVFELAHDMMSSIDNNNTEKLWFLLIVATGGGLITKARDLITMLTKLDKSDEIYRFYVDNIAVLSADHEIVKILKDRSCN